MKKILLVLAVLVVASECRLYGLRAKFNVGIGIGTDFFFDVPRTIQTAIEDEWSLTDRPEGPYSSLNLYCPSDRVLCGMFDSSGRIAGLQIALAQDEFTSSRNNWTTMGFTEWTPASIDGQTSKTYWTIQQYFVSEETLLKEEGTKMGPFNEEDSVLRENAIWLTGFNRELVRISTDGEDIHNSIFTKQACIVWMGRHYYYNMTSETICSESTLFPWFILVNSGEMVGIGFLVPGQLKLVDGQRDWFERPTETVVRAIVPDGPECLYSLASDPGIVTMHIYIVARPWFLGCLES